MTREPREPGWPFSLALAALVLAGLGLRLAWLDQATFAFDQAQVSLRALAMARAGRLAATGMGSSVGVPNLPFTVWCLAAVYRLTTDPLLATAAVALVNALAIALVGQIGRRAWGPTAGLAAAAFAAFSPWAIVFSRSIWAQDLLAPLAALWGLAGLCSLGARRTWPWVALAVLCAGLAPQVHYAGVALWPATLWLILRGRWWRHGAWPGALAGAALALAAAVPFMVAIWPQRAGLLSTVGTSGAWHLSADAARGLLQLGSGLAWPAVAWGGRPALSPALTALQQIAAWMLAAGLLAALAALAREAFRRERAPASSGADAARLVLLWAAGPLLVFTLHSTPVYHHYLLTAAPALALASGYLIQRLCARLGQGRVAGRVLAILLLCLAVLQAGLWLAGTARLATQAEGDRWTFSAKRELLRQLPSQGTVIVAIDCDAHEVCGEAAVWEVHLWERRHRIIDGRHVLLLPEETRAEGSILLIAPEAEELWRTWGHGAEPLAEVGPWRLARVAAGGVPDAPGWQAVEPLTLSTGAQLKAWRTEAVPGALRLWTLWRIVAPAPAGQIQQFNHLRVGDEQRAGVDFAVSARAWQPGDWLIAWADLPAPAAGESATFAVGMYDLATLERATILEHPEDPERAILLE